MHPFPPKKTKHLNINSFDLKHILREHEFPFNLSGRNSDPH